MRDYYGSLGFSCVLMGLLAFLVLAASPEAAASPEIEQTSQPRERGIEAEVRSSTETSTVSASTAAASAESSAPTLAVLSGWGEEAGLVARRVAAKYGAPDETTTEGLVWRHRGPWKRILVRRDAASREFPVSHSEYLEQTISYAVPPEKFADLAKFDGGLLADRGRGELTARSDREEANVLALNLADEIARGKRSVDDARKFAKLTLSAASAGKESAYTQGLLFPQTRVNRRDADGNPSP